MPVTGRPTKLNPERAERAVALARTGVSNVVIAEALGVGRKTFQDWLRRGAYAEAEDIRTAKERPFRTFHADFLRARAEGESYALGRIQQLAEGGFVTREIRRRDGTVEITRSQPDWRALAWYLERCYPERYSKRVTLDDDRTERPEPIGLALEDPVTTAMLAELEERMAGLVPDEEATDA